MKIKSKRELLVKGFVQNVSSPTTYSKRYKKVCKLLDSSPELTEEQWFYIWRGLYYSIWYTEMGKGCEELATKIGTCNALPMILTGFKSLTNDWFGIDAFRIDKYMFLVRIMINNSLKLQLNALSYKQSIPQNNQSIDESLDTNNTLLSIDNTNDNVVESEEPVDNEDNKSNGNSVSDNNKKHKNKKFFKKKKSLKQEIKFPVEIKAELIDSILTIVNSSIGLTLHINDLFLDELIKAMEELKPELKLKSKVDEKMDLFFNILLPFVKLMALSEDSRVRESIKQNIFNRFKNEVIVSESINTRQQILQRFVEAMISIGSVEDIGKKNRDAIYNVVGDFKSKLTLLSSSNENKGVKRRKIVTKSGNKKKVRYQFTSASPFVRSIVPIAVV